MLLPQLSALAFQMQTRRTAQEAAQVRIAYDEARLLPHGKAHPEDILRAGVALGVLEQDLGRDEVLYVHQLLQEYFAARHLARAPQAALVQQEWRAERVTPSLQDTLQALADSDPLPPLPSTGWEETTEGLPPWRTIRSASVTAVMVSNLPLAGRCAAQPEVKVPEAWRDQLRWALVQRTQDADADLRARIAAGLALGELGDPRFETRQGPFGIYLLPPLIDIPGGTYRIGSDEGLYADEAPVHRGRRGAVCPGAIPRHQRRVGPVSCRREGMRRRAGGRRTAARAWRRGEGTAEGPKQQWREQSAKRSRRISTRIRQLHRARRASHRKQAEDWEADRPA